MPTQRTEHNTKDTAELTVNNSTTFPIPLYAMLNGESVRILGMGDVEGKSPCYLFVGVDGRSNWENVSRFQIIDPTALPASERALRTLGLALTEARPSER